MDPITPDLRVVRSSPWSERNGRVVIMRQQPRVRGLEGLRNWVHWAWHPKRIRLDGLGSFVWRRLEGHATLQEIADAARAEFPDKQDAIVDGVAEFIAALWVLGLVSVDRPDGA